MQIVIQLDGKNKAILDVGIDPDGYGVVSIKTREKSVTRKLIPVAVNQYNVSRVVANLAREYLVGLKYLEKE